MAQALPPEEDLPIFDTTAFYDEEGFLTKKTADKLYLKFPVAQGDETLLNAVVSGDLQINNKINFFNSASLDSDVYIDYIPTDRVLRIATESNGLVIEPDSVLNPGVLHGQITLRDPSKSTPFNTTSGSNLGTITFNGHSVDDTSDFSAYIRCQATGNFSNTSKPANLQFWTTPPSSTTPQRRILITEAGLIAVGSASLPLATMQIQKNTTYQDNLLLDGSIPAVGGSASDSPLFSMYANRGLGETGRLQTFIISVAGSGSTFSEKYDVVARVGAFDDLNRRFILCSGVTGGLVLKNRFTGIQVKDPTTALHIQNPSATAETITVDGNNASVSINQYLQKSVPANGNIEIYTTSTAGSFSLKSEAGDSGIKSDSAHNLILGTGTFSSIVVAKTNGRVGIGPNVISTDITSTFTVTGHNTDRLPMRIRTTGTATFVGMNLTCAGPTASNSAVNSDVNGLHLEPHVTARGCQISGDVCPRINNTYECGAATLYWNTVRGFNAYIAVSDERLKTEIKDLDLGMDFINKLRPVSFKWKIGQNETTTERDEEGNLKKDEDGNILTTPVAGHREHLGLIAQDVGALTKQIGRDLSLWSLDDKDDIESGQTLKMAELISPIIKALQDIDKRLKVLEGL
jgi:hypothetical protein